MDIARRLLLAAVIALTLDGWSALAQPQQPPDYEAVVINTIPLSNGIYVLTGAGGNIGVLAGSEGLFVVDNQYPPLYRKIEAALTKISHQPVRYVVNTHWHGDHIGGNEFMVKNGALVLAHEEVRARLIRQRSNPNTDWRNPPVRDAVLPVVTYRSRLTLHFNGEDIELYHPGPSHTDGDTFVYFRKANVLHTGDLFGTGRFPVFIPDNGGSVNGMILAMEQLLQVANAETKIIPGHGVGPVSRKELQEQHDMLVVIRDRVLSAIRSGKTLEQVIALKPTAEFDSTNSAGTRSPNDFVFLVYGDLAKAARAPSR
jgi:cyclase